MPRALWTSWGGWRLLMSEVPLYFDTHDRFAPSVHPPPAVPVPDQARAPGSRSLSLVLTTSGTGCGTPVQAPPPAPQSGGRRRHMLSMHRRASFETSRNIVPIQLTLHPDGSGGDTNSCGPGGRRWTRPRTRPHGCTRTWCRVWDLRCEVRFDGLVFGV